MAPQTRFSTSRAESRSAETADAEALKTRRPHTKSRNGCIECKRRHIRCDEGQPMCANCETAKRTCSFPPPKVAKQKQKQRQRQQQWHQYRPKQDQRPEATATASLCSQVSSRVSANDSNGAEASMEHEKSPHPALDQPNSQSDESRMPDRLFRRSCTRPDPPPSIASFDTTHRQISSSASSLQLDDPHDLPPDCYPGLLGAAGAISDAIFSSQHMILLRNADRVPNFHGPICSAVDTAINHAVDSPYLIDEVLSFTAFHMTNLYPGSTVYLRQLATELQTRALASFSRLTQMVPYNDRATAVPRFLFSAILGRHMIADTLAYYRSDFHLLIDRFVECLVLNRGVTAVTPPAQDFPETSEIQPFLRVILNAEKKLGSPGDECNILRRLMNDSDLSEASAKACRQAIGVLQRSFDICHVLDEEDYPQCASIFLVRTEVGFVDMLRKYRPEALIILAYYGILLHRCRSFWAYGDNGGPLVHAIAKHVGNYWQEALAWPLYVLATEPSLAPLDLAQRSNCLSKSPYAPS